MTVRGRGVLVIVVALAGVALAAGLAIAMRRTRAGLEEAYQRDRAFLRMRAGATRPPEKRAVAAPVGTRNACVGGVDGFATAVTRTLVDVPRSDRRARLAAILAASDMAARAEKLAELDRSAPTLPQRMGSTSTADGSRKPIEATRRACDGKGFAELDDWRPAGAVVKRPAAAAVKDVKKAPEPAKPPARPTKAPETRRNNPKPRR